MAIRLPSPTVGALVFVLGAAGVTAQQPAPVAQPDKPITYRQVPATEAAVLRVENRPVVTFRAEVLSRSPAERADAALRRVMALSPDERQGTVSQRTILDIIIITVGGQDIFGVTPADADELAGESQLQIVASASALSRSARVSAEVTRSTCDATNPPTFNAGNRVKSGGSMEKVSIGSLRRQVFERRVDRPVPLGPVELGRMADRVHAGRLLYDDDVVVEVPDHQFFGRRPFRPRDRLREQFDHLPFRHPPGRVGDDRGPDLHPPAFDERFDLSPGGE